MGDRLTQLTHSRLGDLLAQLCAALGKPFGAKGGEKMVTGYMVGLEMWSAEAVEWAIWRLCGTWKAKGFPKPAEIAEMCQQSGKGKLPLERDPARPTEAEIDRCHECREWWGYHRVVSRLVEESGVLLVVQLIRHADRCSWLRAEARTTRLYRWSYADGPTNLGELGQGGQAWAPHYPVMQLIDPLPPTPAQLHLQRLEERGPGFWNRERRKRAAYDAPRIQPAPIAAALPAAVAATEQGRILQR
jgi:hypothetical protein